MALTDGKSPEQLEDRENVIRSIIAQGKWRGTLDNYTTEELKSILELGEPRGFTPELEIDDTPVFLSDDAGRSYFPNAKLNETHSMYQDMIIAGKIAKPGAAFRVRNNNSIYTNRNARRRMGIIEATINTVRENGKYNRVLDFITETEKEIILELVRNKQEATIRRHVVALIVKLSKHHKILYDIKELCRIVNIKQKGLFKIESSIKLPRKKRASKTNLQSVYAVLDDFKVAKIITPNEHTFAINRIHDFMSVYPGIVFREKIETKIAILCVYLISPVRTLIYLISQACELYDINVKAGSLSTNLSRRINQAIKYKQDLDLVRDNFTDIRDYLEYLREYKKRGYFNKKMTLYEMNQELNKKIKKKGSAHLTDMPSKINLYTTNNFPITDQQYNYVRFLDLESQHSLLIIQNEGFFSGPLLFIISFLKRFGAIHEVVDAEKVTDRLSIRFNPPFSTCLNQEKESDRFNYTIHMDPLSGPLHANHIKDAQFLSWTYIPGKRKEVVDRYRSIRDFIEESISIVLILREEWRDELASHLINDEGEVYRILTDSGSGIFQEMEVFTTRNYLSMIGASQFSKIKTLYERDHILQSQIVNNLGDLLSIYKMMNQIFDKKGFHASSNFDDVYDRKVIFRVTSNEDYHAFTSKVKLNNVITAEFPLLHDSIESDIQAIPRMPKGTIVVYLGVFMEPNTRRNVIDLIRLITEDYGMYILIHTT